LLKLFPYFDIYIEYTDLSFPILISAKAACKVTADPFDLRARRAGSCPYKSEEDEVRVKIVQADRVLPSAQTA
jgi:hypothetical protein